MSTKAFHHDQSIYILITASLQNDFFLADDNRICLPRDIVAKMLIGTANEHPWDELYAQNDNRGRRKFKIRANDDPIKKGPLYRFFEVITKNRTSELHIIHVKDWHIPSSEYDAERRIYGSHCEAGSWGAAGIESYEEFLEPWNQGKDKERIEANRGQAQSYTGYRDDKKKVTYYEVLSNSLFDFRPPDDDREAQLKLILDRLIKWDATVYVVTIGVYSDIRMMTLLTGLRTYRGIDNLITSDVLTAAPNLERHLVGLDFADKVLGVEIIHSLDELVSVMGAGYDKEMDPRIIQFNPRSQDYRDYFRNKQIVLAYQDTVLAEYSRLISQRADRVYNRVFWVNNALFTVGFIFLVLTIIGGVYSYFHPEVSVNALALTGGLGTIQILSSFFLNPLKNLQQNLDKQVQLRNQMETYKTYGTLQSLLRHHLTKPELLEESGSNQTISELLKHLDAEIKLFQTAAPQMLDRFSAVSDVADALQDKSPDGPKSGPSLPNPLNAISQNDEAKG